MLMLQFGNRKSIMCQLKLLKYHSIDKILNINEKFIDNIFISDKTKMKLSLILFVFLFCSVEICSSRHSRKINNKKVMKI